MNNIKFDVPYNWDSKIIQFYIDNQERIEMVYGRADDWYPQWRKTNNWVQISLDDIYLQNKKLNENWIKFNYLLNWTSHWNQEYDKEYRKRFINHVKNLRNNWIKIVTIGNLFLLEAVISEVQWIDIAVSVLLEIDSLVKVKTVCQLWVKYIFLSKVLLKNFNALKNINNYISKNYPDIKLFLLANDPCLNQCLYTNYHNETLSLLTWNNKNCNSFCRLQCTKKFSSNTGAIISASFIRPEDLDIYSGYWYNYIKLCDRKQTTNWLKRMFNAYIAKDYNWELSDIMAPWSKYNWKYPQIKEISINNFIKDWLASYRDYIRFTPKINNKHLEWYLKFWIYNKSNWCINEDCDVCWYCQSLANKYITETEDYKILQTNLVNAIKSNFL
jgi:collagenase-like PrtC family protease